MPTTSTEKHKISYTFWNESDGVLFGADLHRAIGHETITPTGGDFFAKYRDAVYPSIRARYETVIEQLIQKYELEAYQRAEKAEHCTKEEILLMLFKEFLPQELADYGALYEASKEAMYEICKAELQNRPQKNPPKPDPKPYKTGCHLKRVK